MSSNDTINLDDLAVRKYIESVNEKLVKDLEEKLNIIQKRRRNLRKIVLYGESKNKLWLKD